MAQQEVRCCCKARFYASDVVNISLSSRLRSAGGFEALPYLSSRPGAIAPSRVASPLVAILGIDEHQAAMGESRLDLLRATAHTFPTLHGQFRTP